MQVGEGTYGEVYLAREKATGREVALKKVRMENEKEGFPITAIREIKILKALNHPNIINLIEVITSKSSGGGRSIYMVFEAMSQDLTGLIESDYSKNFSLGQVKCYLQQLFEALHYCHKNGILHRDLKPSNILLNQKGEVKLADFGLSRPYSTGSSETRPFTNRVVTLWYRPPELLLGATKYGPGIDMWSAGCIMGELLLNKPLLPADNEPNQLKYIWHMCGTPDRNGWDDVVKLPLYPTLKPTESQDRKLQQRLTSSGDRGHWMTKSAVELLDALLTLDPEKRISAESALNADFFWSDPMPTEKDKLPTVSRLRGQRCCCRLTIFSCRSTRRHTSGRFVTTRSIRRVDSHAFASMEVGRVGA